MASCRKNKLQASTFQVLVGLAIASVFNFTAVDSHPVRRSHFDIESFANLTFESVLQCNNDIKMILKRHCRVDVRNTTRKTYPIRNDALLICDHTLGSRHRWLPVNDGICYGLPNRSQSDNFITVPVCCDKKGITFREEAINSTIVHLKLSLPVAYQCKHEVPPQEGQ